MKKKIERLESLLKQQQHLLDASYALHSTLDLDEVLERILTEACRGVSAERGTVYMFSDDRSQIWSRVLQGDSKFEIRLPVGTGIAGAVAATGKTINIPNAQTDSRFDPTWDKETGFKTRQILCAPIRHRNGTIVGVFQLLNKERGEFTEQDEQFLAALSLHAALAIENTQLHRAAVEKERQDREISIARDIQRSFQPVRAETSVGSLVAAGMNELCKDASGDYYDFLSLPDGRLGVAIGDVSDHGLGASLLMAKARAFLRAFAGTKETLQEIMEHLNDALSEDMSGGNFMCLFLCIAHPETGEMEWCNAGNPAGYLARRKTGEIVALGPVGPVLGAVAGVPYPNGAAVALHPGDTLLLYTDGVTEATGASGEMFGAERLRNLLIGHAPDGPMALIEAVHDAVVEWTGSTSFDDDLTMVALQRSR